MRTILFIIFFSATPTTHFPALTGQVVWNVGQGQWFTAISDLHCYHFDLGGEVAPLRQIHYHCRHRRNTIFLSHWDWDHISFLRARQVRALKDICIAQKPQGKSSAAKARLLASYQVCENTSSSSFSFQQQESKSMAPQSSQSIAHFFPDLNKSLKTFWSPLKFRSPNESSHVFIYDDWLLPGDSPKKQEKLWSKKTRLHKIRFLLLGHHGSHTSTSEDLLKNLPHLNMAIASARLQKHGHPHPQVQGRLRARKIPLLKTEDWGNLWFL